MPRQTEFKQTLCADINGFSLHAAVRCAAEDRDALEQLCRYITRPALANERVQINAAGQVVLKLKTAWRDGTTHLVMSPLEFMQRLAALVGATHSRALGATSTAASGLTRTTAQLEPVRCDRKRLTSYSRRTAIWCYAAYALSFRPDLSAAFKSSSHFDFFAPIEIPF